MSPTQSETLPDLTGTLVDDGRYELIELRGAGAYGKLYAAHDRHSTSPSSVYALKCIRRPAHRSDSAAKFQARERHLHARVSHHANIVTLHRCFHTDAHVWIQFDMCDGGDVYGAIVAGRFYYQPMKIKRVFNGVVDAVLFCHKQGVYHRDVKPENLLLTGDGEVKLCDFGLATGSRISNDMDCGSCGYQTPESFSGPGRTSYSVEDSDKWALCILLLNLVSATSPWHSAKDVDDPGFLAFLRSSFATRTQRIRHLQIRDFLFDQPNLSLPNLLHNSLRQTLPSISIPLTRVMVKALNPDPSLRPSIESIRDEALSIGLYHTNVCLQSADGILAHASESDAESVICVQDGDDDDSSLSDGGFLGESIVDLPAQVAGPWQAPRPPTPGHRPQAAPLVGKRILKVVRKMSTVSRQKAKTKARRFSDVSSFAPGPPRAALAVQVDLGGEGSSDVSSVEEPPSKSGMKKSGSMKWLAGKLAGTWPRKRARALSVPASAAVRMDVVVQ
ncbi:Serine/threonine protein kinase [Mycena chlorophos]|uniref:Serine/threonine protein kinase n=1 Tax=Mycena chlorophos TaxID=658473 RepID=A0A8H6WG41_MYCCL|nr:Serine/threonine protein kinase [Mycena chlorophos]